VADTTGRSELDPTVPSDALILAGLRSLCVPTSEPGCLAHVEVRVDMLIVRGILAADPRVPGAVGRWLDKLPLDLPVLVPAVASPRLAGMLERRGFRPHLWMDPGIGFDNAAMYRAVAR
jgi:hypothetical protein